METKEEIVSLRTLNNSLNDFLEPYGISTHDTDIFEHAMLSLGNINENPRKCQFMVDASQQIKKVCMVTELSEEKMKLLIKNLNGVFGEGFCDPEVYSRSGISFSLPRTLEEIDTIKKKIKSILGVSRNLLAYQRYAWNRPKFKSLIDRFDEITQKEGISAWETDCVARVLPKMFGYKGTLGKSHFNPGEDFAGSVCETHFFLPIPEDAAKTLVKKINKEYNCMELLVSKGAEIMVTNKVAALFVSADVVLPNKGNSRFCEIIIDTAVLETENFFALFRSAFSKLVEDCALVDELRLLSNTQPKPTIEYANELENLAAFYQKNAMFYQTESTLYKAHQGLGESLSNLAATLKDPEKKNTERKKASDNLKHSITFFESQHHAAINKLFEQEEKAEIKTIQKELRLG